MKGKRGQRVRDWKNARHKVDEEGRCRNCKQPEGAVRLEAAHTLGREYDAELLCLKCNGTGEGKRVGTRCGGCNGRGTFLWVDPDLIIPLCGPATTTSTCHGRQHANTLDILPIMSGDEQVAAVRAIVEKGKRIGGSGNIGIAEAYRRLTGQAGPPLPSDSSGSVIAHRDQRSVYDIIENG